MRGGRSLQAAFVVSGVAGLAYEVLWSRYIGLFVGHGAYAQVLWVLQLDRELDLVADPGLDRDGLAFSVEHKRVMPKRQVNNDF